MQVMRYLRDAISDVAAGMRHHEIWIMLGWAEIRQRYRRSTLGPFWLTLSMAFTIGGMGPLYGRLFNQDISSYIAYLAVGLVVWSLISNIVLESSAGFVAAEGFIKEFNMPLSVYILRVVWRNFIVFAHNFVVVVVVLIFFTPPLGWSLTVLPLSLFIIAVNGLTIGLLLGILCTRFRDLQQIVQSIVTIAFFLTPVMWRPEMLGTRAWVMNFNPVYFFIESVRAPLLGTQISTHVWLGLAITTVTLGLLAMMLYGKYRFKIAYWL